MLPVLFGTAAFLAPLFASRGAGLETAATIAGLAGLAGVQLGLVMSDATFPDGKGGFGRAAGLWLGLACLMPAVVLGEALHGSFAFLFMGAAIWVMASGILFGQLFRLSAGQALRFSAIFYGGSCVLAAVSLLFPSAWPYIGTAAWLGGGFPAAWINTYVRLRYPEPMPSLPIDADDEPEEAPEPFPPTAETAVRPQEPEGDDEGPPLPAVPAQTAEGSQLALRWAMSVFWDYTILAALFVGGIRLVREMGGGMDEALTALGCFAVVYFLYQPLGERFGGTFGQRMNGIRIIEPGYPDASPDASVVAWRAFLRIGLFWGVLSALFYWLEAVFVGPEERARLAQGRLFGRPRREWMFIER